MEASGRSDMLCRYFESLEGGFIREALPPERQRPRWLVFGSQGKLRGVSG